MFPLVAVIAKETDFGMSRGFYRHTEKMFLSWTGSPVLPEDFSEEILSSLMSTRWPTSFQLSSLYLDCRLLSFLNFLNKNGSKRFHF